MRATEGHSDLLRPSARGLYSWWNDIRDFTSACVNAVFDDCEAQFAAVVSDTFPGGPQTHHAVTCGLNSLQCFPNCCSLITCVSHQNEAAGPYELSRKIKLSPKVFGR